MVAYHFPPFAGSSGVQRALRFAAYLPEHGWEPIVLSVHPRAYEQASDDLLDAIPRDVPVIRAPAWDAKRHFSIGGRCPGFLVRPDRWRSWWLGAVPAGLRAIRQYRPDALWSTYPIPTAHSIAATLARFSAVPWIADFRDPMAQDDYPTDPATWRSFDKLERLTVARAGLATFTTPSAVRLYQNRYPARSAAFRLLENGYDESSFPQTPVPGEALSPNRVTLLHSGAVYPAERDPTALFAALAEIKRSTPAIFERLLVRFRAPGHADLIEELGRRFEVSSAVEILPAISYVDAIDEICRADCLLLLQASSCNAQIPAKFYEYVRARRPILLLTDPQGDTAVAANSVGVAAIARLDDTQSIARMLTNVGAGQTADMIPSHASVERASRRARTRELAELLTEVSPPIER